MISQELSKTEEKLIAMIREFGYGQMTLHIKSNKVIRVEKIVQSIEMEEKTRT